MTLCQRILTLALTASLLSLSASPAAESLRGSLKPGNPELKSVGPLAFGPEGILFVGDPQAGTVVALDTGDRGPVAGGDLAAIPSLDGKISSLLGVESKELLVNDLAVNPLSGQVYFSVARGRGPDAQPVIVRADRAGKLGILETASIPFSKTSLPEPAEGKGRAESITDLAYVDGKVIVAGLSTEEFASTLRTLSFPFADANKPTSVEIYHGAHGKLETRAPVRTFIPVEIDGEKQVLAAYTCTPLVRFPVSDLKPGAKVRGTTIAELGNRNRPLDIISYSKAGKNYLLIANSARGLMKVNLEGADKAEPITSPISGTAGLKYDSVADVTGVEQLDKLDDSHAVVLVRTAGGSLDLKTIDLP